MARDYFDNKGNLRGTSVSRNDSLPEKIQADLRSNAGSIGVVLLGIAFLFVGLPLILLVSRVFMYLDQVGVHALFSMIASACTLALAIYCLVKFRLIRALYVGLLGVLASGLIFYFVADPIWSWFFILLIMSATIWFGREIYLGRLLDV